MAEHEEPLPRVRAHCLGLPETEERLSHGAPTFFIRGKRAFVMYLDNHHDDGRLALWCAAPPGMQQAFVASSPEQYFVPPYVGHRGWLGVRLDRGLPWEDVAGAIEDAYVAVAPKALLERLGQRAEPPIECPPTPPTGAAAARRPPSRRAARSPTTAA